MPFSDETSLQFNLKDSGINLQSFHELNLWVPKHWFTEDSKLNGRKSILHRTFVRETGKLYGIKENILFFVFQILDGFLGFSVTKLAKKILRKRKTLILSGLNKEYSLQYAFLDVKEHKPEVSTSISRHYLM